jgi:hypothetical protein
MSDAWPSPDSPPGPLPRIEELPIVEQGYDQEAVRLAFDSFYRHAAQLDASLRALEAVEVFRRDADALRNDLRALRSLGVGGSDSDWTVPRYESTRAEVPVVAFRLAAEAALIVAVAVIAGVANLAAGVVIALMAAAFVVVACSEWLASRGRYVPPPALLLAPAEREPAPYIEAPPPALEPGEDTEPEALTIVGAVEDVDAAADPWETVPEPEDEPEPEERAGLLRRLRR